MQHKIGTVVGHRHRDGFEAAFGELLMEPDQGRHFTDTDHTAGRPEIHQYNLAPQTRLAQALPIDQCIGGLRRSLRMEPETPAEKTRAGQEHQRRERLASPARQRHALPNQGAGYLPAPGADHGAGDGSGRNASRSEISSHRVTTLRTPETLAATAAARSASARVTRPIR